MSIRPLDSATFSGIQPKTSVRPADRPSASAASGDRIEIRGALPEPVTYSALRPAGGPRKSDVDAMFEASRSQVETFVKMLGGMVEEQGLEWSRVVGGEQRLTVDPAVKEAAVAAIGPDGAFGVEKTAGRILAFAKAMIGGDPKKLATIRAAVETGFAAAEQAFGGKLPDLSHQTMDAVRSAFDAWEKTGLA